MESVSSCSIIYSEFIYFTWKIGGVKQVSGAYEKFSRSPLFQNVGKCFLESTTNKCDYRNLFELSGTVY